MLQIVEEIRTVEAYEFESNGSAAASGGSVDGAVRQGVEGNGGVGLGDGVNVRGDGRGVERIIDE